MITVDLIVNKDQYPNAIAVDLTTTNEQNCYRKLSPYYPHGGIPIPNTPNTYFASVYDVWQNLLIIDDNYHDSQKIPNYKFKKGLYINDYWTYSKARQNILIPLYCWMLEEKAYQLIEYLRNILSKKQIVILDTTTNNNVNNCVNPLSCGFLLKAYLEGTEPYQNAIREVIEPRYIMVGRREFCIKTKKYITQKIANIPTDIQLSLDF